MCSSTQKIGNALLKILSNKTPILVIIVFNLFNNCNSCENVLKMSLTFHVNQKKYVKIIFRTFHIIWLLL